MSQVVQPSSAVINAVQFANVKTVKPARFAISWIGLEMLLSMTEKNADKTNRALWSPVEYYHLSTRGNQNVKHVTCLVVDMDGESFDYAKLDGLEYVAYTTWSHEPGDEHWHLVLPLARPVPGHLWGEVWSQLHERINVVGDPQTKDPARMFYMPQYRPGVSPQFRSQRGRFLDPDLPDVLYVRPQARRNPRTFGSAKKHYWQDEAWWNEPQDLSRFNGLTKQQIAVVLRREFAELCKSLDLD
jgi:hypothetical protein